jgi:hypothetical protein
MKENFPAFVPNPLGIKRNAQNLPTEERINNTCRGRCYFSNIIYLLIFLYKLGYLLAKCIKIA